MKLLLYCTKAKPMLRIAKEEFKGQKRARCYSKEETEYFTQYIEKEMYEANGKIRPTKKPDIDNILKSVFDSLNQVAFYDDTQIIEVITSKYYAEMPKIEIEIERVNEDA